MDNVAFKCPRGYDPCKQIGCSCRADHLKARIKATPGMALRLLHALMEPIDEPDIESMTDEEVEAHLVAEGFDIEELDRKLQERLAEIRERFAPSSETKPSEQKAVAASDHQSENVQEVKE
jgi:hypothetical protein